MMIKEVQLRMQYTEVKDEGGVGVQRTAHLTVPLTGFPVKDQDELLTEIRKGIEKNFTQVEMLQKMVDTVAAMVATPGGTELIRSLFAKVLSPVVSSKN